MPPPGPPGGGAGGPGHNASTVAKKKKDKKPSKPMVGLPRAFYKDLLKTSPYKEQWLNQVRRNYGHFQCGVLGCPEGFPRPLATLEKYVLHFNGASDITHRMKYDNGYLIPTGNGFFWEYDANDNFVKPGKNNRPRQMPRRWAPTRGQRAKAEWNAYINGYEQTGVLNTDLLSWMNPAPVPVLDQKSLQQPNIKEHHEYIGRPLENGDPKVTDAEMASRLKSIFLVTCPLPEVRGYHTELADQELYELVKFDLGDFMAAYGDGLRPGVTLNKSWADRLKNEADQAQGSMGANSRVDRVLIDSSDRLAPGAQPNLGGGRPLESGVVALSAVAIPAIIRDDSDSDDGLPAGPLQAPGQHPSAAIVIADDNDSDEIDNSHLSRLTKKELKDRARKDKELKDETKKYIRRNRRKTRRLKKEFLKPLVNGPKLKNFRRMLIHKGVLTSIKGIVVLTPLGHLDRPWEELSRILGYIYGYQTLLKHAKRWCPPYFGPNLVGRHGEFKVEFPEFKYWNAISNLYAYVNWRRMEPEWPAWRLLPSWPKSTCLDDNARAWLAKHCKKVTEERLLKRKY